MNFGLVSLLSFQARNLPAMLTTAARLYFHVNLSWISLPSLTLNCLKFDSWFSGNH